MEISKGKVDFSFWKGKKVFLTGHTGFKGSWLSLWLQNMGALVKGYSLNVNTNPALFTEANVAAEMESEIGDIRNLHNQMLKTKSEMGTLASKIKDRSFFQKENIVKVLTKQSLANFEFPEAINFMRKSSDSSDNVYHHLGIYCYSAETLERFVKLEQSQNEIKNRLEQLRALDNNIEINVSLAKSSPIGVDTEEDYLALKKIMEYKA